MHLCGWAKINILTCQESHVWEFGCKYSQIESRIKVWFSEIVFQGSKLTYVQRALKDTKNKIVCRYDVPMYKILAYCIGLYVGFLM